MSTKPTKIIGMSLSYFDDLLEKGEEFHLQPARLIPFYKPGDEMAITSIFLAAIRLITEFRNHHFLLSDMALSADSRRLVIIEPFVLENANSRCFRHE
jgi:hypothetical protein